VTNPSSLPTAFVATYTHGKGGRTFGFTSEFDALKDVGHGEYSLYRKTVTPSHHELWLIGIACGHNLIAVVGVAAAAGLKACLKACNISGTVKLVGSPGQSDSRLVRHVAI
jgi:metal-dependent amidase/aminoacylase/carboxypeptidase family protein